MLLRRGIIRVFRSVSSPAYHLCIDSGKVIGHVSIFVGGGIAQLVIHPPLMLGT